MDLGTELDALTTLVSNALLDQANALLNIESAMQREGIMALTPEVMAENRREAARRLARRCAGRQETKALAGSLMLAAAKEIFESAAKPTPAAGRQHARVLELFPKPDDEP